MNGGTRLSYYNYTIEVKILHLYFVVSVITHINANLTYLFIYDNYIYIYLSYLFIYIFIYLFII